MYIRFDPKKVVLPSILGGPQPHARHAQTSSQHRHYEFSSTANFAGLESSEIGPDNYANLSRESSRVGGSAKKFKTYHEPTPKNQVKSFEDRAQLMQALRDVFMETPNVDFAGTYRLYEPGVTHQQRIKSLMHEIWEVTGYRFTIKDHPFTNYGHKTRLWCSQDEAHKMKPSKSSQRPRTLNDGALLGKPRYPCRSSLLISSREEGEGDPGICLITVRMHHHVAHEPYYDNTLPPEITQSIWANICRERKASSPPKLDHETSGSVSEGDSGQGGDKAASLPPNVNANAALEPQEQRASSSESVSASSQITEEVYQKRMQRHINNIRDFCDGLEYQLSFNDFGMLEVLEQEGAQFLQLVKECLRKEGRLKEDDETTTSTS